MSSARTISALVTCSPSSSFFSIADSLKVGGSTVDVEAEDPWGWRDEDVKVRCFEKVNMARACFSLFACLSICNFPPLSIRKSLPHALHRALCFVLVVFHLAYKLIYGFQGNLIWCDEEGRQILLSAVRIRPHSVRCPSRFFGLSVRPADGQMRMDGARKARGCALTTHGPQIRPHPYAVRPGFWTWLIWVNLS